MRVLIIGTGAVASVLSKTLTKDKNTTQIVCASRNLERAKQFIDLSEKKISLKLLDASRLKQMTKLAKGFNLVINASLPQYNRRILHAALEAKANYQDLNAYLNDGKTPEQLAFSQRFQQKGLVGLFDTGVSPGITNLLAKDAAEKLDEVLEIKIRLFEDQDTDELIFAWSPETTLDELVNTPLAYQRGFRFLKPLANLEKYEFPQPFGVKKVVSICSNEVATLPRFIKLKKVNHKAGGSDIDLAKALYRLGLLSKKPVFIDGQKIVPLKFFAKIAPKVPSPKEMEKLIASKVIENAYLVIVVEVIGKQAGKTIAIKNSCFCPDLKAINKKFLGATYISYPTGIAAAAFTKIIPKIKAPGIFPPEALSSDLRKEIFLDLEKFGFVIHQEFSKA